MNPRSGSKIQDSRKNFLDPRSGSKIQDPRFQEKLLGSTAEPSLGSGKALSSDPRSFSWNLGSWILDPDLGSKKFFLESWILDPDLGSKKFFLESWILDLGSRPWIQEFFPRISVFINVYKHHLQNHPKNALKKRSSKLQKNTVNTGAK